jgi:8-oxo-dGTP pyrophosphatase MutT (NUDIX family)
VRGPNEVAIFVARRGRAEVLVVHRSPEGGGYWHTIAGGVEPGETADEAARRELLEETGFAVEHLPPAEPAVEFLYALSEETADRQQLYEPGIVEVHVDCFIVDAPDDWEPMLDHEHDGYRWVAAAEAADELYWPDTANALRRLLASFA